MDIVFNLLGGLGIFLFGINLVGDSLRKVAGNKLKSIIEKSTNTAFKGILVGILITMIIQSSSATTALVVALVAAGLMNLKQAAGIVIGANVGTSFTSFLIGLNFSQYALIIIGASAIVYFVISNKKVKNIASVFIGFGFLFFGLKLMGDGLDFVKTNQAAQTILISISKYPILALFIGLIFTIIVQSSSASVGIIQTIYASGSIGLTGSIAMMFGCCIGTTITAVIASLASSKQGKRVALFHVLYNVFAAILFMVLLTPYSALINLIETHILTPIGANKLMSIAMADILYKVIAALILVWFMKYIIKLTEKIIKGDEDNDVIKAIDQANINNPSFALELSKNAIEYMSSLVKDIFENLVSYTRQKNNKYVEVSLTLEDKIDIIDSKIHDYLIKVARLSLNTTQSYILAKDLDTIRDLERISDHCTNIIEFFQERYANNESFSEEGNKEINNVIENVSFMFYKTIQAFAETDTALAQEVLKREEIVDNITEDYRRKHLMRVYDGKCKVSTVDNYSDILSNFERIGDHCTNICDKVIAGNSYFEYQNQD